MTASTTATDPGYPPQPLEDKRKVDKVIKDIEFLVHRCDEHIHAYFPEFLTRAGCTAALIAQVGY